MGRLGMVRLWNLLATMVMLGAIAAPQVSSGFVLAGEDRTTATADDVVRIDADFEAGDYVWQSTALDASNEGDLVPFRLGFLVSITEPLNLITDAGSFSRLLPGQAMGVADGDGINVQTLTGKPGTYVAVELVPAEDAEDTTAPAFPLESGQHELSLQLFRPPTGDAIEIRQLIQPILILVQSGEFTLEPLVSTGATDDEVVPLGPGDSSSLLFDTRLRQSGDDPTAFFVATLDAPGSETDDESSAAPSAGPSATTTTSLEASPSQAASPRSVTVRPSAASSRPFPSGSVSPSPSAEDEPPRSAPSAKSSPPEHVPVRK